MNKAQGEMLLFCHAGWIADLGRVDTLLRLALPINDWPLCRGAAAEINGDYQHAIANGFLPMRWACCRTACGLATEP